MILVYIRKNTNTGQDELLQIVLAVELQPYGSKNLDGYRRAVVPPIQKT
jgi:hypothetical protein